MAWDRCRESGTQNQRLIQTNNIINLHRCDWCQMHCGLCLSPSPLEYMHYFAIFDIQWMNRTNSNGITKRLATLLLLPINANILVLCRWFPRCYSHDSRSSSRQNSVKYTYSREGIFNTSYCKKSQSHCNRLVEDICSKFSFFFHRTAIISMCSKLSVQ